MRKMQKDEKIIQKSINFTKNRENSTKIIGNSSQKLEKKIEKREKLKKAAKIEKTGKNRKKRKLRVMTGKYGKLRKNGKLGVQNWGAQKPQKRGGGYPVKCRTREKSKSSKNGHRIPARLNFYRNSYFLEFVGYKV
jgi:hypothetical protein